MKNNRCRNVISKVVLLCTMVFIVSVIPGIAGYGKEVQTFAGGNGSEDAPYLIKTAEQLQSLNAYLGKDYQETYWQLAADIDLGQYLENSEKGWKPIGHYKYVYPTGEIEENLFWGNIDGDGYKIEGLWLDMSGNGEEISGLFSAMKGSKVKDLEIVVDEEKHIKAYSETGILSGYLLDSEIENCKVTGKITGNWGLGGFAGVADNSTFKDCHAEITIEGQDEVGGFAGETEETSFYRCTVKGTLVSENEAGGLASYVSCDENAVYMEECHIDMQITGGNGVGGLYASGEGGEGNISIRVNNCSVSGIITGAGEDACDIGGITAYGDGCTITGTHVSADIEAPQGNSVGGIMGMGDYNSSIIDCIMTGDVIGSQYVGGLVGMVMEEYRFTIRNSKVLGNVTGEEYTGGLIGSAEERGSILNSYMDGSVTGGDYTGGLAGYMGWQSIVSGSYFTGQVTGGDYTGGLSGSTYWVRIENSYAAGTVRGQKYAGGLVGQHLMDIKVGTSFDYAIRDNYAAAEVNGISYTGGLIGECDTNQRDVIEGNIYDIDVSEQESVVGSGYSGGMAGKSSDSMKMRCGYNKTDWDFDEVWGIYEGYGYPYLKKIGNNILVKPDPEAQEKNYDGQVPEVPDYIIEDNYDESIPVTGALKLNNISADAGTYKILNDNLKGKQYQMSFKDDERYIVHKAAVSLDISTIKKKLVKDDKLIVDVELKGGYQPSGMISYAMEHMNGQIVVENGRARFEFENLQQLMLGMHDIQINYSGDRNHKPAAGDSKIEIEKMSGSGTYAFPVMSPISYHPEQKLEHIMFDETAVGKGIFSWENSDIVPTVETETYKVVFVPSDTDEVDYSKEAGWKEDEGTITRSVAMQVNPAVPEVIVSASEQEVLFGESISFTAEVKGLTYTDIPEGEVEFLINGEGVSCISLEEGKAVWTTDQLTAGIYNITASYKGKGNYTAANDICQGIVVKPAVAPDVIFPVTDEVTYSPTQTLSDIPLKGGDTEKGTFVWTKTDTVPTVDVGQYLVTFTPSETENIDYSSEDGWDSESGTIKRMVSLVVNRAEPEYEVPEREGMYGNTVGTVELPDGWWWKVSLIPLEEIGVQEYPAMYTSPTDQINYKLVNESVPVDVHKRPVRVTALNKIIPFAEKFDLEWKITAGQMLFEDKLTGTLEMEGKSLGCYPITEKESFYNDKYDITFEQGTAYIVPNEAMWKVIKAVWRLPDQIKTREQADDVAAATNLHTALTEDEKAELVNIIWDKLKKAQQQSAIVNHTDGEISVQGLPWHIRLVITKYNEDSETYVKVSELLKEKELEDLYHIMFIDTLTGQLYEPDQLSAKVTIHTKASGKSGAALFSLHGKDIHYEKADIKKQMVSFELNKIGYYGIAADKKATGGSGEKENPGDKEKPVDSKDKEKPRNKETNSFVKGLNTLAPRTGDYRTVMPVAIVLMVSFGVFVISIKKRKKE